MTENDEVLKKECQKYLAVDKKIDFTSTYVSTDGESEWVDPTTTRLMFERMMNCIEIKPGFAFLDCGSGLGHILYLASFYFDIVRGVEILPIIYKKCCTNLNSLLPGNSIEVFNADMFELPENVWNETNVFYISSPFQNVSDIARLVEKITCSAESVQREIYVIYYYPYCREVFTKYEPFFVLENSIHGLEEALIYHHIPK